MASFKGVSLIKHDLKFLADSATGRTGTTCPIPPVKVPPRGSRLPSVTHKLVRGLMDLRLIPFGQRRTKLTYTRIKATPNGHFHRVAESPGN